MRTRIDTKKAISPRSFDVCVIGGGATGLGSALDAQLRGMSVVLVDAGDFVAQTSSASTKLVHGGVRYLQQAVERFDAGQFQMVRKALHERIYMLEAAPFLARPLELLVPCFSAWQLVYMAIGMKMYEVIAGKASLFPSRILSSSAARKKLPTLRMKHVAGAVSYADGQFDDARYGMTLAASFAEEGGELLNYARVVDFERDVKGKLTAAVVEDQLTGERSTIRAKVFLNCTGPFADGIRLLAHPGMTPRLRVSKGIHILLPLEGIKSETALLIPKTEDGRVIFAIPWFGSLLVGTTEDEVEVGAEMAATESEISYLLKYVNQYLECDFGLNDVKAAFAGARPLVASEGSVDTKKLVRDHEVEVDERSGLISILGGKWTTYRAMAEDGVNHVMHALGGEFKASTTRRYKLAGADGYSSELWRELMNEFAISEASAHHLSEKFGSNAVKVLRFAKATANGFEPLYAGSEILCGEVLYTIHCEMATSIDDVLGRRIGLEFHDWQGGIEAAAATGRLLAAELQWSEEATQQAIDAYKTKLSRRAQLAAIRLRD